MLLYTYAYNKVNPLNVLYAVMEAGIPGRGVMR
jgi:hypothetical protein